MKPTRAPLPIALLSAALVFGLSLNIYAQTQIGWDLDGEVAYDLSGWSVSMPDAQTVAIGARFNDGNGTDAGHVRVYAWDGNVWVQKGADIDGEAAGDWSGYSVSMPDAQTVAIGATRNNGFRGHVRVYAWNGSAWVQQGADINGEGGTDGSGGSVSMPHAQMVAIGATGNGDNGSYAGHVRVHAWNGSAWVQQGSDIDGEAADDRSGVSVSMPDAQTVAIGAFFNDGNGIDAGHVRVYAWNGIAWIQKGVDIDGEVSSDISGYSVSMPDAQTVAIGAPENNANGTEAGQVRVYAWNGSAWVQKGADIDGEAVNDRFGFSVSMPDAQTMAAGGYFNDGNGSNTGHVRVYTWNGSAWVQQGADIGGEAVGDESGRCVSMPDAQTLAIGAQYNEGSSTDEGHVRVYGVTNVGIMSYDLGIALMVHPNPTDGPLRIDLGNAHSDITLIVRNVLGQQTHHRTFQRTDQLDVDITGAPGVYFIEVTTGGKHAVLKVAKV